MDISFRDKGGGLILHRIDGPTRVFVKENDAGQIECLEIEDAAGAKRRVYFEEPLALGPADELERGPAPAP